MRVAIVHDWLTGMRGGERILNVFCKIFPQAELFTLIHEKGFLDPILENRPIHTSFLQNFPSIKSKYRNYLPLFPLAVESFNLKGFDLIISSSHCVAKGAKKPKASFHFCYCYTPMRYMWVFFEQYFGSYPPWKKSLIRLFGEYLKRWDIATLPRVDEFVAISQTIKNRIRDIYKRDSTVIYPPVEIDKFKFNPSQKKGDYYLCVSALVPYKRIDIMVEAFNKMPDKKLVIVGDGNLKKDLEARRTSPNIKFTGWVHHDEVVRIYEDAKAFIFAAEEDFGIAPVEAQALGLPVIAYGKGGTTETIIPINGPCAKKNATGLFFFEQTADGLIGAINEYERREREFNPADARQNAERFSEDRFVDGIKKFVTEKMKIGTVPIFFAITE
jgi:glycosyltransferase involved in cell wall biosynthesis